MRHYKLIDYLTQGYVALVGLLVVLFHNETVQHWQLRVVGHVVVMAACHVLIVQGSMRRGRFIRLLRAFYPIVLYGLFYTEVHDLDRMFLSAGFDGWVIDLDQRLFGRQPCRTLMARFPQVWVSEVFYLFYFTYYAMVGGVGFGLYYKRREQFCRYVTVVSFIFYLCYLIYIILPVSGPYGTTSGATFTGALASVGPREIPAAIRAGPFYKVMAVIYLAVDPEGGAAFPSSHVAVAVATLWFTWHYLKRARWLHLVAVAMLCLSTVYCGYHYAADVLAGLAMAAVTIPVGMWLHRWCRGGEGDDTCFARMPEGCPE